MRSKSVIEIYEREGKIWITSNKEQTIRKDTRVGQFVITPIVIVDFVKDKGAERGKGAFGSTGE